MKTYAHSIMLCFLIAISSPAKIKNGYAVDIKIAHESLKSIKALLDGKLPLLRRTSMKMKMEDLIDFITYYELTEKLLDQFRMVSPALYLDIDTLTDKKGRNIDVYVKFVPENNIATGVAGTTNLAQDENDSDAYKSKYGIHTVSVRVVIGKKSLHLLAHELGHVRYQVPNLAAYMQFFTKSYFANTYIETSVGHNDNDPSGQQAITFLNQFRTSYLAFIGSGERKLESPFAILQVIKDKMSDKREI